MTTDIQIFLQKSGLNFLLKHRESKEYRLIQRYRILQLNRFGMNSDICSWYVGCHKATVNRWIKRIQSGGELQDRKRSGRPPIFKEDIMIRTISFYCQISPLGGCSSWSLRLAANYLREHPEIVGCSMSYSSIHRILNKHSLRPHRWKYFLHITDPEFFKKMEHIIDLYLNPPEYLFCYDECTGIQATQRLAPDFSPSVNLAGYKEFEYVRNGTTNLMAFLRTKTGEIFGRCTKNHKTTTLVEVFKEHVKQQPTNVQLHYICDNYSTHFHDLFCQIVADLSGVSYNPLETGKERRNWLQLPDKRIVIHFLPFHGSWLNMIEIWFGILKERCLKNGYFKSVDVLNERINAFIETWNSIFLHPFKWTYKGENLHQKVIHRFIKLLCVESNQLERKYLKKKFMLLINLASNYWSKVKIEYWKLLLETVIKKVDFLKNIIGEEKELNKLLNELIYLLALNLNENVSLFKCA